MLPMKNGHYNCDREINYEIIIEIYKKVILKSKIVLK